MGQQQEKDFAKTVIITPEEIAVIKKDKASKRFSGWQVTFYVLLAMLITCGLTVFVMYEVLSPTG